MLYRVTSEDVKPAAITGRRLAHLGRTPIGRAFVAVDIYSGLLIPTSFTLKQSAALAGANVIYTRAALHADPADRALIETGVLPLKIPTTHDLDRVVRNAGIEPVWQAIARAL